MGLIFWSPIYGAVAQKITIDQFVDLALKQSDDVRVARNNFENSVNSFKSAYRSSRLPQADVSASLSKSKSDVDRSITRGENSEGSLTVSQPFYPTGASLSGTVSESTSRSESLGLISRSDTKPRYSASLNQPIFLFQGNNNWRSWKRSRINYEIAEDNYRRNLQQIRNSARSQYYNILLRQEQLKVEEFKLESSERAHKITEALVNAGRYAGIELSRSEVRLNRDRRRLENAKTLLSTTINDAVNFVSLDHHGQYAFVSELVYKPLTIPLERLIEFSFLHRPDYKAAKSQLDLSEISLKETREADNPNLSATGSVSRSDTDSGANVSTSKNWTGGLNLSWNIFDSRITKLNVMSAQNDLENQKISFQGLKRDIETDVTNAYLDVKRAETQLDDLKTSREQARKAVKVVQTRYKNGIDRLVDLFDSENELRDVELEYLDAIIAANLATENLELLIGGTLNQVIQKP